MDATTIETIVSNLRAKLVRQLAAVALTKASIEGFQTIDFADPAQVSIDTSVSFTGDGLEPKRRSKK